MKINTIIYFLFYFSFINSGAKAVHKGVNSRFGDGKGDFVLDEVRCRGTEEGLHLCPSRGWGNSNNCDRDSQVAGVTCMIERVASAGMYGSYGAHYNEIL